MTAIVSILDKQKIDEKIRVARAERYACQSAARIALSDERVATCLRHRLSTNVAVMQHKSTKKSFYDGLMVCGSVWACPVCAAKISEKRKLELKQAFQAQKDRGDYIALLTLTFSHTKRDKLKDLLERFSKATQKLFSGKAYNNIRADMGLLGRIRVFEVTYGANGFHPHVHIALFYTNFVDLEIIKMRMYDLWFKACLKFGLKVNKKHGLDLQSAEDADEYLAKHGSWSLEQEMSKAHIKVAKKDSMTPFDFLRNYLVTDDADFLKLFKEYYFAFKGRRQLSWSPGLKDRFEIQDKTDEDLAKEKTEDADLLGLISAEDWKHILKEDKRAELLNKVEKYGFETAMSLITKKKVSSCDEDTQKNAI